MSMHARSAGRSPRASGAHLGGDRIDWLSTFGKSMVVALICLTCTLRLGGACTSKVTNFGRNKNAKGTANTRRPASLDGNGRRYTGERWRVSDGISPNSDR